MRGGRSFLALLAILLGLGAYLYFVESKRDPTDPAEKRDKVFALEADKIEEVSIKSEAGQRTTLRKNGTDWEIVEPTTAKADAAEISGITTNLSTLEQQRLVEENPSNLADFGLNEPRIEVGFKSGGAEQRLLIGSKTPTGSDLYAKTAASPRVFLVASYLESTFNRSTFDLRDKAALKFERDSAESMQIVTAERTLSFGKKENQWQINQPAGLRADTAAIEGLLARLNSLQMKSIVESTDKKDFGLEKPAATVHIGAGSAQTTLLVGGSAGEGAVYARDASRPTVFTVESSLLDDLKKDLGEYRQKDVFDARAFNTDGVEIARGSDRWTFDKKEKWQQTAPATKDADGAKIEGLLSSLTSARADGFVDKVPTDAKTELSVTLKSDEGRKQERVTFFRSGSDAFAQREGTPGAARFAVSVLDGISKAVEDVTK